ncbi:putative N-acetyltransferase camello isoform X1 [Styela clava]
MCSGLEWTVDGFDFRIRELDSDDISEVRGMVVGCLYKILFMAFKGLFVKNWRTQIVLSGLTALLLINIGYDAQYITIFVLFQTCLLGFTDAVSFYCFFAPEITTFKKEIVNADKTYLKFWISEVFEDGEWKKVGTAALHEPYQLDKCEFQTGEITSLKCVSVSRDWRSKKMGTMLLKYALSQATLMNYKAIILRVIEEQPTAVSMYKKNGFEILKVKNTACLPLLYGINVYVMARNLG